MLRISLARGFIVLALACAGAGCAVGPDYKEPPVPTSKEWRDPKDPSVARKRSEITAWWTLFQDPVLNKLVELAVKQNPTLHGAAVRVVEAQARRGVAFGQLFPQQQEAFGAYTRNRLSENRANNFGADQVFSDWDTGLSAAWELDVWGKFRRGVEAADAQILATLADYDDALVSLIAEVASSYISYRAFEEGLGVSRANVEVQRKGLELADARFKGGTSTELDPAQATALLRDTESQIPRFEAGLRQQESTLCVLLGIPPRSLADILGGPRRIPNAPAAVAVGLPADLLRRRPDVRGVERRLAAQSAIIGIAKSDFYPRFTLVGEIAVSSEHLKDLPEYNSVRAFGGPTFSWSIFNYGRILNNVRAEDALFQALEDDYTATVLRAQGEVESAIAGYLGARRQVASLTASVAAATRAAELAETQYRGGIVDYTRVLDSQQFRLVEEDRLVVTRSQVAQNLIQLYRALGGGWELREGKDIVASDDKKAMKERTWYGDVLSE